MSEPPSKKGLLGKYQAFRRIAHYSTLPRILPQLSPNLLHQIGNKILFFSTTVASTYPYTPTTTTLPSRIPNLAAAAAKTNQKIKK